MRATRKGTHMDCDLVDCVLVWNERPGVVSATITIHATSGSDTLLRLLAALHAKVPLSLSVDAIQWYDKECVGAVGPAPQYRPLTQHPLGDMTP